MVDKEIIELFKIFIDNRCTPQELERVLSYIKEGRYLKEWDLAIEEQADSEMQMMGAELMTDLQKKVLLKRIDNEIDKNSSKGHWKRYVAAAVILVALTTSILLYNVKDFNLQNNLEIVLVHDSAPGGNVATLTLADGTIIVLDDAENGKVAMDGNASIVKEQNGELVYVSAPVIDEKPIYNRLATPRGGQYSVVLPDGTKAWLNAASSIVYPTSFNGENRLVEVKGEVYFEVTPNKNMPFIVSTIGQRIEVLGTHFNVNAYEDEDVIRTTLLEGSVRVTLPSSASSVLSPGDQSLVVKGQNKITLTKVDTEAVIGWKNGDIHFDSADLKGVLRQLGRWYNVDVDLTGVPDKKLNGIISRSVNLSAVLEAIEKTSNVKMKIENMPNGRVGRRISME